jgi:hypothetical protein
MLFITSDVDVSTDTTPPATVEAAVWNETDGAVAIQVHPSSGEKCPRCWRYVPTVSQEKNTDMAGLCPRCIGALSETVGAS